MDKPVFVIGKNRSGTKWLSNVIANHSDVACVQREGAGGIVETNMFSNMSQIFGDLSYDENYFGMAVCFSESNFFKLTGLDKGVLFKRKIEDYFALFHHIMDLYTENQGKKRWLQKSSVSNLAGLYEAFPDAKFIIIERNIFDNIRSARGLAQLNNRPVPGVIREGAKWQIAHKTANRYKGKSNVMFVTFEQLKNNRKTLVKNICSFLELQFNKLMLQDSFKKNTSFQKGLQKEQMLSSPQFFLIKLLNPTFRLIPFFLLRAIGFMLSRRGKEQRLVAKSFSLLRENYGWGNNDG